MKRTSKSVVSNLLEEDCDTEYEYQIYDEQQIEQVKKINDTESNQQESLLASPLKPRNTEYESQDTSRKLLLAVPNLYHDKQTNSSHYAKAVSHSDFNRDVFVKSQKTYSSHPTTASKDKGCCKAISDFFSSCCKPKKTINVEIDSYEKSIFVDPYRELGEKVESTGGIGYYNDHNE